MARIDWKNLLERAQEAAAFPTTTNYASIRLRSFALDIDRELARRADGKAAKTPLTARQRAFAEKLINESRVRHINYRAEAAAAVTDDAGNILVDPAATPWEPACSLAPVRIAFFDAVIAKDEERQRQCEEVVRAMLSDRDALTDWLREAAQMRGSTLDAIAEELSLHTSLKKGHVSSRAAAQAILRFWPETWTVERVGPRRMGAWGDWTCTVQVRCGDGLLMFWTGLTRDGEPPVAEGDKLVVGSGFVSRWGDPDDRFITRGRSYPSKTFARRVKLRTI